MPWSRKTTYEDGLGLRVGSSPFALAKSEEARLESKHNRKQGVDLLESSSCILNPYIFSTSSNFKKSYQSCSFPLIFLLRKKSGMWEEMLVESVVTRSRNAAA